MSRISDDIIHIILYYTCIPAAFEYVMDPLDYPLSNDSWCCRECDKCRFHEFGAEQRVRRHKTTDKTEEEIADELERYVESHKART